MLLRSGLVAVLSVFALLGLSELAFAEKRVALVIGNSGYSNAPNLPNPANDASSVAALLKTSGFDVVQAHRDLGIVAMRRALREFSNEANTADIAVVFFAGHGIEVDGVNYLIPTDAKLESDFDVKDETISLDRVLGVVERAKQLHLVILDACRENPFTKTMARSVSTRAVSRGLARVEPTTSDTLIAFAAKAGSLASDGSGMNSPFTTALLQYIALPGIDVRIALGKIRDEVIKSTGHKQEPFVYGSLGGGIVSLVPLSLPAQASPVTATDLRAEVRRDYEVAERVGTREAWDYFLAQYSSGFYANMARAHRLKIIAVESITKSSQVIAGADAKAKIEGDGKLDQDKTLQVAAVLPQAESPLRSDQTDSNIARHLQLELMRVGCHLKAIGSEWNADATRALEAFNKSAKTKLEVKVATTDALEAVQRKVGRVCPLICSDGFRVEGEKCVREKERPSPSARHRKDSTATAGEAQGGIQCKQLEQLARGFGVAVPSEVRTLRICN